MREKMAVVLVLTLALTLALAGCGTGSRAVDLMEGITAEDTVVSGEESSADAAAESNQAAADFAVRLLQEAIREDDSGGNVLLSPLSVLFALAMTANGAGGRDPGPDGGSAGHGRGGLERLLC